MIPRNSAATAFVPAAPLPSQLAASRLPEHVASCCRRTSRGLVNLRSQHDSERGPIKEMQKPRGLSGTPRAGVVARAARTAALLGAVLSLSLAPLSLPVAGLLPNAHAEEPQSVMMRDLPVDIRDPYAQVLNTKR